MDLVELCDQRQHDALIRRAKAEPRAANAAALKKLRRFVAAKIKQQVRGKCSPSAAPVIHSIQHLLPVTHNKP